MVKPIPIYHNAQVLYNPQESIRPTSDEGNQTEVAVPELEKVLRAHTENNNSDSEQLSASLKELFDKQPLDPNQEPQPGSIEKALKQLNDKMRPWSTGIRFEMDPDLDRLVVSIVDSDSGEVLRTIPSEALLQVARMITTFQGQGVDTQA